MLLINKLVPSLAELDLKKHSLFWKYLIASNKSLGIDHNWSKYDYLDQKISDN
jgi:hypothetical protein